MRKIVLLIWFLIAISSFAYSQIVTEQKYRLAESYEKNGDFESASRLYGELVNLITPASSDYDKYFDAYMRTLRHQSRYTDMVIAIEKYLEHNRTYELLALYGEISWRLGNTDNANKAWKEAISNNKNETSVYALVSQYQIDLRLFDRAIATLEQGRKELKQPSAYADPMSRLYIATGNYQKGSREVINLLNQNLDLSLAQGRIYALMYNDEATEYIFGVLAEEARKQNENLYILDLYGWFLRSANKLDEALDTYQKIDKLKAADGLELLRFADRSRMDGQYDIALKAYRIIIDMGKNNRYAPSALYGFTRTLEMNLLDNKNIQKKDIQEIIRSYRIVIKDYPKTQNDAQARLRIADLAFNYLNDAQTAIKELNGLIEIFPNNQYTSQAFNMLGDIYVSNNKLEEASSSYRRVINMRRTVQPVELDKAMYNLAMLEFYIGNIDTALVLFQGLSTNPDSEIANDALKKIQLISQNIDLVEPLKNYAKAELYIKQNEIQKAIDILLTVYQRGLGSDLSEIALIKVATLYIKQEKYIEARKQLNILIESNDVSIYADLTTLLIGDTYFYENNFDTAMDYYSKLLAKYPRSIYLDEARFKILNIRKRES